MQAAAAGAGCLLVPLQLAGRAGFPFSSFQAIVVHASEPGLASALRQQIAGVGRPLHFLEVALPSEKPHAVAATAEPAAVVAGTAEAAGGAAKVLHAARPAAAAEAARARAAQAGMSTSLGGLDWPVIISSDLSRPLR